MNNIKTELGISAGQPERLQEENPNIITAVEKLNSLLTFYSTDSSTMYWKDAIERHRSTLGSWRRQHGDDSIASILPLNTFEFDHIPNILIRAGIRTKAQLVGLNEDQIGEIDRVG